MEIEKVYSINEDGNFISLDDILEEISEIEKYDKDTKIVDIYEAEMEQKTHVDFFDASNVIEDITNRAYEDFDDYSENYCADLERPKHKEAIEKLILKYLNENVEQPNFFTVRNIKKVAVKSLITDNN